MGLKDTIHNDMKTAMKAGEKGRLSVIRLIMSAIKQKEVDEQITLNDNQVQSVIEKMIKQRRDSVQQYRDGGRNELALAEEQEIELLQAYMPEQLSEAEVDEVIDAVITETGAASMKDMGGVMGKLKSQLQGKADLGTVSAKVKDRLSN